MIVVFGSVNADLVVAVERLPAPGETVKGPDHQIFPGGKGANQALAAQRAGAGVALVGAVGEDGFADAALALLRAGGIDLTGVKRVDSPTGLALIAVDVKGGNQIVVASGANMAVDAAGLENRLDRQTTLVLQLELPLPQISTAIATGREAGARMVLNAAPYQPISLDDCAALDVLIVNEGEARALAAAYSLPAEPELFAASFAARNAASVVVTLGGNGVAAHDGNRLIRFAAPDVSVVDTTGAGDAFVGAFSAAIDGGRGFRRAVTEGVAAGSLACTVTGAQPGLPFADAIADAADRLASGSTL